MGKYKFLLLLYWMQAFECDFGGYDKVKWKNLSGTSSPVRTHESVPDALSKPSPDGEIIIRSFAASRSPPRRLSCPERRTFIQFQYRFINLNQTFNDLQILNFRKNQKIFPKH